jgi:electron transport complex protein RnfD
VVTGLLLALVLPPRLFPTQVAGGSAGAAELTWLGVVTIGAVFGIAIGKQVFGGLGSNIFNPALIGRAFLMAAFPTFLTTWTMPVTLDAVSAATSSAADAVTGATPLAAWKFAQHMTPLAKLFLGNIPGSLGETSALALLLGGLFLLVKRYADWRTPVGMLGTVAALTGGLWLYDPKHYASPAFHLLAGGLLLGAFFMATDPVTTPVTKVGRWVFGIGAGALTVLIRLKGGLPEGVMYSILLMNSVTPLVNRFTRPRQFGEQRRFRKVERGAAAVQMVLVLGLIGLVSGASLAAMHLWTRARIAANVKAELESKVATLFPGALIEERKLSDESTLYEAKDEQGKLAGYAFLAVGMGYQGEIKLVVGVTPDLKEMVGLAVMPTSETPGLGQRIEGAEFRQQFAGLEVSGEVELVKGGRSAKSQISAITGATVSSTAVVDTLNKRMAEIRKLLSEGK